MGEGDSRKWMLWWWGAVLGGAALAFGLLYAAIVVDRPYGTVIFLASPFIQGASVSYTIKRANSSGSLGSLGGAIVSCILLVWLLLLTAGEGAFCVLTAGPIWLICAVIGSFIGKSLAGAKYGAPVLFCVMPLMLIATIRVDQIDMPIDRFVETSIDIDASPEEIWPLLFNLSNLGEPDTWYFRAGVACPMGTESNIESNSRTCILTTGKMRETITLMRPCKAVRWRVDYTPKTMREWNPFGTPNPKHLTESFRVLEGGFEMQELSDGKTRLRGWTTYRSEVAPDIYWNLWNEMIVRGVQRRVMTEIAHQAQPEST